ncbi:MAG: tetratricopeptide repeat protein [Chloroflexi bacterium]|nr:tetratricopeptide repeat protein [Chloroflexota bacterium]
METWAKEEFPGYESGNAADYYGDVMQALFLNAEQRQLEIERQCEGKFPGFGYATLANLVALEGGRFNVVLTTNFDDLIADALYLYTEARPLVILHESLATYIRPTRTRPLVVKLHGDNRLSPQNTVSETEELLAGIGAQVRNLLNDRGLIFVGYGGNDKGIERMLRCLPPEALPLGIYWVSGTEPQGEIRDWLESREAVWVEKGDFDELMLLVRDVFSLRHPDQRRFERVFEQYMDTYKTLSAKVESLPDTDPDASALKQAVVRTDQSFPDWWAVGLAASRFEESDPDQADNIYREGVTQFPGSAELMGNYAAFLENVRNDYDGAEERYRRALEIEPNDADHLGNYANFLRYVRDDYDGAEDLYRRSLEIVPDDAVTLANFAGFLLAQGRDFEGLPILEKIVLRGTDHNPYGIQAERWFYAFAHQTTNERAEALRELKQFLIAGGRSPEWDLAPNIVQARKDGHPDVSWLEKLAAVISDGADIETLGDWPDWQNA